MVYLYVSRLPYQWDLFSRHNSMGFTPDMSCAQCKLQFDKLTSHSRYIHYKTTHNRKPG